MMIATTVNEEGMDTLNASPDAGGRVGTAVVLLGIGTPDWFKKLVSCR